MATFEIAYSITLGHEGSYVNDPNDVGGETYMGIAHRYHDSWKGWDAINNVKVRVPKAKWSQTMDVDPQLQKDVRDFYKAEFWDKVKGDQISEQEIANELFDTAVNMGVGGGGICFQNALNLLNKMGKDYSDIKADGAIGNITVGTFNAYMGTDNKYRGRTQAMNVKVLLKAMNGEQYMRYHNSATKREKNETFFYGWVANRIGEIE